MCSGDTGGYVHGESTCLSKEAEERRPHERQRGKLYIIPNAWRNADCFGDSSRGFVFLSMYLSWVKPGEIQRHEDNTTHSGGGVFGRPSRFISWCSRFSPFFATSSSNKEIDGSIRCVVTYQVVEAGTLAKLQNGVQPEQNGKLNVAKSQTRVSSHASHKTLAHSVQLYAQPASKQLLQPITRCAGCLSPITDIRRVWDHWRTTLMLVWAHRTNHPTARFRGSLTSHPQHTNTPPNSCACLVRGIGSGRDEQTNLPF